MNWPLKTLGDLFDIARGGSPRPIDAYVTDDLDGINWIAIGDASEDSKYITKAKRKIRKEGATRSRLVQPGDFLLTNSMSFGHPYILQIPGCIHDGWLVLTKRKDNVDSDFFYHLLGSREIYTEFERQAAGATVKNLNIELVKAVRVHLPPLEEQKRISSILEKADALRKKRRLALQKLNSLSQSIFLEMFGDHTNDFGGCSRRPLGAFISEDDRINYGVVQPGEDCSDGVPLVRVGDFTDGALDLSHQKRIDPRIEAKYKRSRLKGDELLVSCVGSIGTLALCDPTVRGMNIARAVARIPADSGKINPEFLLFYLRTQFIQNYFRAELRTVNQPTLNIKQIEETPVCAPDRTKQEAFAARIKKVRAIEPTCVNSRDRIDALFSSLQFRAFRGEL